jgi:hypothetical protein
MSKSRLPKSFHLKQTVSEFDEYIFSTDDAITYRKITCREKDSEIYTNVKNALIVNDYYYNK